jgi:hypothetical protein
MTFRNEILNIFYMSWAYRKSDGAEVAQNQQANITFFYGKENKNHQLGTDFFVHKKII